MSLYTTNGINSLAIMDEHVALQRNRTVDTIVGHFFRHEFSKSIAYLRGAFPNVSIDLIEDAVQEGLFKAVEVWPFNYIPDNPTKWILKVARNKLLDSLRRGAKVSFQELQNLERSAQVEHISDDQLDEQILDDQLRMIYACCDSSLSVENQIILTLKILCGFSNKEVARALLKNEDAVAKAYTRGKQKLKKGQFTLAGISKEMILSRQSTVLQVIYLLFNEGYKASEGQDLIRRDLCEEAVRLAYLLEECSSHKTSEVYALQALMCLNIARMDCRVGTSGELLTLEYQDRSKYDQALIEQGFQLIERAKTGVEQPSEYLILAMIMGWHCAVSRYEDTNWSEILKLYDILIRIKPSPVTQLNRLIVISKVDGPSKVLKELGQLTGMAFLENYYLYHAVRGDLLTQVGDNSEACKALEKAIALAKNDTEKAFLANKLQRAQKIIL